MIFLYSPTSLPSFLPFQALSIYAYELGDYALAEKYCHNHYDENDETSKDVYLSLLKVYLHPPPGKRTRERDVTNLFQCLLILITITITTEKEMMLEPALKLLKNYSSNIDTTKVIP